MEGAKQQLCTFSTTPPLFRKSSGSESSSSSNIRSPRALVWRLRRQFGATKDVETVQTEVADSQKLHRSFGGIDLIFIGIGGIIGTGIFVLAGPTAANDAGPSIVLSFVLAGVPATFSALCFAELSAMIPESGSSYSYVYAALGEGAAWFIGWGLLLEYWVGAAAVAVGWSAYFVSFLRATCGLQLDQRFCTAPLAWSRKTGKFEHTEGFINAPAVAASMVLTFLLVIGVRESVMINNVLVIFKLTALALLICFGLPCIDGDNFAPFIPPNTGEFGHFGFSGTLRGASTVFFAYLGFDAATTVAQEVKDPSRDLPVGIIGSLVVCTAFYVAVAAVMVGVVPYADYADVADPMALLAERMSQRWLAIFVSLAGVCGLGTVLLVSLLGQPRILYTMARDGLLPSPLARIHPQYGTPHVATVISGAGCAIAGGFLPIDELADMCSAGTLVAFVFCAASVVALRWTQPNAPRPFKLPCGPLLPLLSALSCGGLACTITAQTMIRFAVWSLLGCVVYLCYGVWYSQSGSRLPDSSSEDSE